MQNNDGYIKICSKIDLLNLKSNVDRLAIGKLETTSFDLSKLSNLLKVMSL